MSYSNILNNSNNASNKSKQMLDPFDIIKKKIMLCSFFSILEIDFIDSGNKAGAIFIKNKLDSVLNGEIFVFSQEIKNIVNQHRDSNDLKIVTCKKYNTVIQNNMATINMYKSAIRSYMLGPAKLIIALKMAKALLKEYHDVLNCYEDFLYTHSFCYSFLDCYNSGAILCRTLLINKINYCQSKIKEWSYGISLLSENINALCNNTYKVNRTLMVYPFCAVIDVVTKKEKFHGKELEPEIIYELMSNKIKYVAHYSYKSNKPKKYLPNKFKFFVENNKFEDTITNIKKIITSNKILEPLKITFECTKIDDLYFVSFQPITIKVSRYMYLLFLELQLHPQKINIDDNLNEI